MKMNAKFFCTVLISCWWINCAVAGGTITGRVRCDGAGIAGVVVTDGVNVVKTNKKGDYTLSPRADADFVRISVPSGYEVARQEAMPLFFIPICPQTESYDFELTEVDQSNYTLLTIADTHVLNNPRLVRNSNPKDRNMYKDLLIPALNEYAASCPGKVYGLHLGDMTQDNSWDTYSMEDFREDNRALTFPLYTCIGNHDHDSPLPQEGDRTETYRAALGPTWYSFNLGREHYVVMDNVLVKTSVNNGYDYEIDEVQLRWLAKDIAAMSNKIRSIVIALHVPTLKYDGTGRLMKNMDPFFAALKNYNVTILVGHNHIDRIVQITRDSRTVTEYMNPSGCGTAWFGPMLCRDGTPASFVAYQFNRDGAASRRIVPFGVNRELTHRIYNKGITDKSGEGDPMKGGIDQKGSRKAIMVNIWGAISCRFIESTKGKGITTDRHYDIAHRNWFVEALETQNITTYHKTMKSPHVWRYVPADPDAVIHVTARDENGKIVAEFDTRIE